MNTKFVTAINGVSGGGKTAISTALHAALPRSSLIAFDEYETERYPDDLFSWLQSGGDLYEFDFPKMRVAIDQEMAKNDVEHIILDYPFGRSHPTLETPIDLSVWIETPLDVAMARGLMRDIVDNSEIPDAEFRGHLREWLGPYEERVRCLFIDHRERNRDESDLILDGCKSIEELVTEIRRRIAAEQ